MVVYLKAQNDQLEAELDAQIEAIQERAERIRLIEQRRPGRRDVIDVILSPLRARVTNEIRMVGRTLFMVAPPDSFDAIAARASELRRALGADQVTIRREIYHVHVEVVR